MDPNFADRVRASFAKQKVMRTLGVEIVRLEPGEIELTMPFVPAYTQQNGFIHAGIIKPVARRRRTSQLRSRFIVPIGQSFPGTSFREKHAERHV